MAGAGPAMHEEVCPGDAGPEESWTSGVPSRASRLHADGNKHQDRPELKDFLFDEVRSLLGSLQRSTDSHHRHQESLVSEVHRTLERISELTAEVEEERDEASSPFLEVPMKGSENFQADTPSFSPRSSPEVQARGPDGLPSALETQSSRMEMERQSSKFQDYIDRKLCDLSSGIQFLHQNTDLHSEHPYHASELFGTTTAASRLLARARKATYHIRETLASKEPERRGCAHAIVSSPLFQTVTLTVIIANGIFMVHSTDIAATELSITAPAYVVWTEGVFLLYYLVELVLKLIAHRWWFFISHDAWWNMFDLLILAVSTADILVSLMVTSSESDSNMSFLRICRVFRVGKSFKMLRALQFVKDLRLLIDCIVGSLGSLLWCVVLLVFVSCIFSVFIVQNVTGFMYDQRNGLGEFPLDKTDEEEILKHFGNVRVSMLSLLKATSGGEDWGNYHTLISLTGYTSAGVFILYILFSLIAAWNIVTSIFMEKALTLAKPDLDAQMLEKHQKDFLDAEELKRLTKRADQDHSGSLSLDEFMGFMGDPNFRSFFELRGLDIKDAEMFFHMMSSVTRDDEVDISTFVAGCLRMRGFASSIDLHALSFEVKVLHINHQAFVKQWTQETAILKETLAQLQVGGTQTTLTGPPEARPSNAPVEHL